MANRSADKNLTYGIDKEISAAIDAKWDAAEAKRLLDWVSSVAGEKPTSEEFHAALKSGVLLCNCMNKLQPGAISNINKMNSPFFQRENINQFLEAARKYGVRDGDLFVTHDLFEGSNLVSVVTTLRALNGAAVSKGFKTQQIGIASAGEKNTDTSKFKFEVKASGDTSVLTKQTMGSKQTQAESVRSDKIIKSFDKSVNPNSAVSQQTSGSKYFGASSVASDKIIKTQDTQQNANATLSQQNAGSKNIQPQQRMDSINRLGTK